MMKVRVPRTPGSTFSSLITAIIVFAAFARRGLRLRASGHRRGGSSSPTVTIAASPTIDCGRSQLHADRDRDECHHSGRHR